MITVVIVSCVKPPKEKQLTMLDVFPKQKNTDSTLVIILDKVKNLEQLEEITCKKENLDKKVYFRSKNDMLLYVKSITKCREYGCILYKERNLIGIQYASNGFIIRNSKDEFTIKNYEKRLTEQFLNEGRNPILAYSSKKVVTFFEILDDKTKPLNLKSRLDSVSFAYFNFIKNFKKFDKIDSLKQVYPLNLLIYTPPPPPPPINKVPPPPKRESFIVKEK